MFSYRRNNNRIDLGKSLAECKKEYVENLTAIEQGKRWESFSKYSVSDIENVIKDFKDQILWWQIATQSLSTLVDWTEEYAKASDEYLSINSRMIFIAFLKANVQQIVENSGVNDPQDIIEQVLKTLFDLSLYMTEKEVKSLPLSKTKENNASRQAAHLFGDAQNSETRKEVINLDLINKYAIDIIRIADQKLSFIDDKFIGILFSINFWELSAIKADLRANDMTDEHARETSIKLFALAMLTLPLGPYHYRLNEIDINEVLRVTEKSNTLNP